MQSIHKNFLVRVIKNFEHSPFELVHITQAIGRVLATDVRASITSPARDMAATDGYAVSITEDLHPPYHFKIVGESSARSPYNDKLKTGCAVKVYAGSPVPSGVYTIVEDDEVKIKEDRLNINHALMKDQNICHKGIDFTVNDQVLNAGSLISARDVGLAAYMHMQWLPVHKKPDIAIFSIGDELSMPGDDLSQEKSVSSSTISISAIIEACGANCINLGVVPDNPAAIKKMMLAAKGCDLLVTTGGVSASASNLVKNLLDKTPKAIDTTLNLGGQTHVLFGKKNGTKILALPGSPISSQICAILFLRPVIHHMVNMQQKFYKKTCAILDRNLDVNDKKMDYIFGRLTECEDKSFRVIPASSYDRLMMKSFAESDCLITVDGSNSTKDSMTTITRFVCSVVSG